MPEHTENWLPGCPTTDLFDALVYDQTNTCFLGVATAGVKLSKFRTGC